MNFRTGEPTARERRQKADELEAQARTLRKWADEAEPYESLLCHPDHDPATCEVCGSIKVWLNDYNHGSSVAARDALHNRITGLMQKAWERGKRDGAELERLSHVVNG